VFPVPVSACDGTVWTGTTALGDGARWCARSPPRPGRRTKLGRGSCCGRTGTSGARAVEGPHRGAHLGAEGSRRVVTTKEAALGRFYGAQAEADDCF
jgi:hypothetical protein